MGYAPCRGNEHERGRYRCFSDTKEEADSYQSTIITADGSERDNDAPHESIAARYFATGMRAMSNVVGYSQKKYPK